MLNNKQKTVGREIAIKMSYFEPYQSARISLEEMLWTCPCPSRVFRKSNHSDPVDLTGLYILESHSHPLRTYNGMFCLFRQLERWELQWVSGNGCRAVIIGVFGCVCFTFRDLCVGRQPSE